MSKIALIAGIGDYPADPLAYCAVDAKAMQALLTEPAYGFECTLLIDKHVTTRRLKDGLEHTLRTATDTAIFYFAGHGAATDYGAFLVTADANDRVDDGLDLALIKNMITGLSSQCGAVVIILDCCHSGSLCIGAQQVAITIRTEDFVKYAPLGSPRRVLLAACKDNQYAAEDPKLNHGIFTYHLLEALAGEASNEEGIVTVNAAYDYVARGFEQNAAQRPVYKGDLDGRVVLGTGLVSKTVQHKKNQLVAIESQAEAHLRDLQGFLAPAMARRDTWHADGHKAACQQLIPVLRWFETRRRESPSLGRRARFQAMWEELQAKLEGLCSVEPGDNLEFGVVQSRLGSGTFGTVWKTAADDRQYAVKVYHAGDIHLEEKIKRFSQGFFAMRRLDHPQIVKVHNLYECPLSFSMDFIEGANLREWVGTLDTPTAQMQVLYSICDTLRHAHSRGVLHRDVKPENVIMVMDAETQVWKPNLTDFDLAWFSTASLQTRDALGCVFYAAPEQLGKPGSAASHAPTVDVFAFGQIMFYLLTGSDPTPLNLADNVNALHLRIRDWGHEEPVRLAVDLYRRCVQGSPEFRPRTMEEVYSGIYAIIRTLEQHDDTRALDPESFARELVFAVTGLSPSGSSWSFKSQADITSVFLSMKETTLDVSFNLFRQPLVDNVPDFKRARAILNQRIEDALSRQRRFIVHRGSSNPYEVHVRVNDFNPSYKEVSLVRAMIVEVLTALERG